MRKKLLLGAVFLAVPLALLVMVLWLPRHHITPENVERITPGMTRAAVEELLGAPAGSYDGCQFTYLGSTIVTLTPKWEDSAWASRDAAVYLQFDEDQRVRQVYVGAPLIVRENWLDTLRRVLRF
jgi:outer membrane protein assembly factor BamE (lipoprotein component of BamABCDE complex)